MPHTILPFGAITDPSDQQMKPVQNQHPLEAAGLQDRWEAAYKRFQTPEQQIRKFVARLRRFGASKWPRDAQIVELFCGMGNDLYALERMGFTHLEGVDLSPALLQEYRGPAKCHVGDCRELPFPGNSRDILIVQGGLHHLPQLPEDLERTFREMHRVLRKDGRAVMLEPWLTPFLRFVHVISNNRMVRRLSAKLDALATMNELEEPIYSQWLSNPDLIRNLRSRYFEPVLEFFVWGKWYFVGAPRK